MKENKLIEKKNLPWINGVLPQARFYYSQLLQVEVPEQGAHVLVHGFLAVTGLFFFRKRRRTALHYIKKKKGGERPQLQHTPHHFVTDLIQGLGGVFIPLALVFPPLVLLSLVFLYGLEGVVSALMERHIIFMYLWGVVESSIRSMSRLEILVVMTMMGTRG
jgi:hypothetical protein